VQIQVSLVPVYQLNLPVVAVEASLVVDLDLVVDLVAVVVVAKAFRVALVDQQPVEDNQVMQVAPEELMLMEAPM
jgi:hypothetical protein